MSATNEDVDVLKRRNEAALLRVATEYGEIVESLRI